MAEGANRELQWQVSLFLLCLLGVWGDSLLDWRSRCLSPPYGLLKKTIADSPYQDLYYRGYYELSLDKQSANASYYGLPTIATRNGYEISLANFTVISGENKLMRTNGVVGGGVAESGSMKFGTISGTNITNDTATGSYFISSFTPDTA